MECQRAISRQYFPGLILPLVLVCAGVIAPSRIQAQGTTISVFPSVGSPRPYAVHMILSNASDSTETFEGLTMFLTRAGETRPWSVLGSGQLGYRTQISSENLKAFDSGVTKEEARSSPASMLTIPPHQELDFELDLTELEWQEPTWEWSTRGSLNTLTTGNYILTVELSRRNGVPERSPQSNGIYLTIPAAPKDADFVQKIVYVPRATTF